MWYRIFFVLLLTFSSLAVPGRSQAEELISEEQPSQPDWSIWSPELALRYPPITETALTADGSHVAYVLSRSETEAEKSEFVQQIWIASEDQSFDVPYTNRARTSYSPAFCPHGRYLAFLSKLSGEEEKTQIWVMRVAGGEAESITQAESDIVAFQWSPDGRSIAYLMADPETDVEKTDREQKRDVILVHQNLKYQHLYLVAVSLDGDGKEPSGHRLTEGEMHITQFDWAPDGESLVIAHRSDPLLDTAELEGDLSIVPIDGGPLTSLVSWPGVDHSPRFSRDGRFVAFVSSGGEPQPVGLGDVFIIEAKAGTSPRPLALTHDRLAALLGWSSDGQAVFALDSRGTTDQIVGLPLDGSPLLQILTCVGSISAVALSRDGEHFSFVQETLDEPPEVFVAGGSPLATRRISSVHAAIPRPPMGKTELLIWTSADGMRIEGLLTYPVGYTGEERVPLILEIHGGPADRFDQHFTGRLSCYPTQVFAQHGYAVLRPNPRGSSGYGREFRYANVRDWGYGDYDDLMAGVDAAIERGVVDPNRLFVIGWSYGGYLTSYVVTRTDRFQAASVGAGLTNLVSMVHTTDITNCLVAYMGDRELWEDYDIYQEHSALYRIQNVVTPTQVIHGAEDLRVPFDQGRELFLALERLNVPTEMIVYPRTSHVPEEPKFIIDVPKRILAWFAKHGGLPFGQQG